MPTYLLGSQVHAQTPGTSVNIRSALAAPWVLAVLTVAAAFLSSGNAHLIARQTMWVNADCTAYDINIAKRAALSFVVDVGECLII